MLKKLIAVTLTLLVLTTSVIAYAENEWYSAAAEKFATLGAISETEDITASLTRAQFVGIINASLGYMKNGQAMVEFDNTYNFNDLFYDSPHQKSFLIARSMGILQGDQNNNANPESLITRSEVSVIISRIIGLDIKRANIVSNFNDDAALPDWARPYIVALTNEGYLKGDPANNFRPSAPITGAETVVLLDRVLGDIISTDRMLDNMKFDGNVTIIGGNVSITNTTISGNLLITQAVKDIVMDNVTIGKDLIQK